jgi:sugar O-acyltransferase (sialic acid O-acetyltransferase NeuD family)
MNRKILLIGGGGHCKSVLDSLLLLDQDIDIGIIDKKEKIGEIILRIPVIGCDDDLIELYHQGYTEAFVTLGSIGNPQNRIRLFNLIEKIGFNIPNIIDPSATISKHVKLKKGIFIGKNSVINIGSFIGNGAIINTSSTIEHDCSIGDFVHIAPGSVLCGEVKVGDYTHIGAGSVIKQQARIGTNTIIGMGGVVLHDISDNVVAFGNPCEEASQR